MRGVELMPDILAAACLTSLLGFVVWDHWRQLRAFGWHFQYQLTDLWAMALCMTPTLWTAGQVFQDWGWSSTSDRIEAVILLGCLAASQLVGMFAGRACAQMLAGGHPGDRRASAGWLVLGATLGLAAGWGGLRGMGLLFAIVLQSDRFPSPVSRMSIAVYLLWTSVCLALAIPISRRYLRQWNAAGRGWSFNSLDLVALLVVLVPAMLLTAVSADRELGLPVWAATLVGAVTVLSGLIGRVRAEFPENRALLAGRTTSFLVFTNALIGASLSMALGLLSGFLVMLSYIVLIMLGWLPRAA